MEFSELEYEMEMSRLESLADNEEVQARLDYFELNEEEIVRLLG